MEKGTLRQQNFGNMINLRKDIINIKMKKIFIYIIIMTNLNLTSNSQILFEVYPIAIGKQTYYPIFNSTLELDSDYCIEVLEDILKEIKNETIDSDFPIELFSNSQNTLSNEKLLIIKDDYIKQCELLINKLKKNDLSKEDYYKIRRIVFFNDILYNYKKYSFIESGILFTSKDYESISQFSNTIDKIILSKAGLEEITNSNYSIYMNESMYNLPYYTICNIISDFNINKIDIFNNNLKLKMLREVFLSVSQNSYLYDGVFLRVYN